jgi:hypothetical protein
VLLPARVCVCVCTALVAWRATIGEGSCQCRSRGDEAEWFVDVPDRLVFVFRLLRDTGGSCGRTHQSYEVVHTQVQLYVCARAAKGCRGCITVHQPERSIMPTLHGAKHRTNVKPSKRIYLFASIFYISHMSSLFFAHYELVVEYLSSLFGVKLLIYTSLAWHD